MLDKHGRTRSTEALKNGKGIVTIVPFTFNNLCIVYILLLYSYDKTVS